MKITPFLKWAGGKRQLLPYILENLPKKFNNYIEPFLGGGAVFFELQPDRGIVNDINKELILTYENIRDNPTKLIEEIRWLDEEVRINKKDFYLKVREAFNEGIKSNSNSIDMAAKFIFLNKHCFNGLYRVNSKGLFNVPYNNSLRQSVDEDNIHNISNFLKGKRIINGDFSQTEEFIKKDDFVFIDSPYAPLKVDSFESYTKEGFKYDDHIRLSEFVKRISDKGAKIMVTNHNTELINELYDDFNKKVLSVKRMINSDSSNRKGEEIIITNY